MARYKLNGVTEERDVQQMTLADLRRRHIEANLIIKNGFEIKHEFESYPICEGDEIYMLDKSKPIEPELFKRLLHARQTPGLQTRLEEAVVGIAGLGGLGSNCAMSLARAGIGKLVLVDFDIVDPTNLNRQHYLPKHLGLNKTEAMKFQIEEINPCIKVVTHNTRIDDSNALELFKDCGIVVEAFDNPVCKAELVNTLLLGDPKKIMVAASGMAGYGRSNEIQTAKIHKRMYLVGDRIDEAREGNGLMAPRVWLAAMHQSNLVMELILGDPA